jgi:hypothetical protein
MLPTHKTSYDKLEDDDADGDHLEIERSTT